MNPYRVHLKLNDGASVFAFDCDADDLIHAVEQAQNAYPDDPVVASCLRDGTGSGDLRRDADGEGYTLPPHSQGVWINVDTLSVNVKRADEGVVIDVYPIDEYEGEAIASTWAMFQEAHDASSYAPADAEARE